LGGLDPPWLDLFSAAVCPDVRYSVTQYVLLPLSLFLSLSLPLSLPLPLRGCGALSRTYADTWGSQLFAAFERQGSHVGEDEGEKSDSGCVKVGSWHGIV